MVRMIRMTGFQCSILTVRKLPSGLIGMGTMTSTSWELMVRINRRERERCIFREVDQPGIDEVGLGRHIL